MERWIHRWGICKFLRIAAQNQDISPDLIINNNIESDINEYLENTGSEDSNEPELNIDSSNIEEINSDSDKYHFFNFLLFLN